MRTFGGPLHTRLKIGRFGFFGRSDVIWHICEIWKFYVIWKLLREREISQPEIGPIGGFTI